MVAYFPELSPALADWALSQSIFFTGSAPLAGSHINLSPKGLPSTTFSVLSPTSAAYLDATGSGNETISHLYENGRITIELLSQGYLLTCTPLLHNAESEISQMFCSFSESPRILRLFCTGEVIEWDSPRFDYFLEKMGKNKVEGARAVISLKIWKVQTSCGYGVPRLNSKAEGVAGFADRETLGHWAHGKVEKNEMLAYQVLNNVQSLDGLPGLRTARRDNRELLWIGDLRATARRIMLQREALAAGVLLGLLVWLLTNLVKSMMLAQ